MIDYETKIMPFVYTDYYEKEFGRDLKRAFISISKLINPADLYRIKILSNKIEEKFSRESCRSINIDPGYINHAKLVLASTKDFAHRIHLNKGIFAEITLSFKGKNFTPLEWSYPDYRTSEYIKIFNEIRDIYVKQTRGKCTPFI